MKIVMSASSLVEESGKVFLLLLRLRSILEDYEESGPVGPLVYLPHQSNLRD